MFDKIIKDYFSFSRKERMAVLVLMVLIIVILLLPKLFPGHSEALTTSVLNDPKNQITKPGLPEGEKDRSQYKDHDFTASPNSDRGYATHSPGIDNPALKAEAFYFDPNKLSADGWKKLGLRDKTILTIHNYLSKGGKFKSKEDIRKIYGLSPKDAERLIPYVSIANENGSKKHDKPAVTVFRGQSRENYSKPRSVIQKQLIDLNLADTTELIALPGIGSKLANRIVNFREKLGGFYSVDQLSEIYGLPDSTFQRLRPSLNITNTELSPMNLNTVSLEELKQHPYIKWNLATTIVEFRRQHGNFKSVSDLKNIALVTNEIYMKIIPYFKVE